MKHFLLTFLLCSSLISFSQEENTEEAGQDDTTKALDATATQWSFQFAYQSMPDYHSDIVNGAPRTAGLDNYVQLRIVAPIPLKNLTILPRVTLRHYENVNTGDNGFGNTEIFALIIPKSFDWGTGRTGIGPMVTLPGNKKVARDEWGYGLSGALVNSSGRWFYGVLLTQSWRSIDPRTLPAGSSTTNPLGIAPFLNYRIGDSGLYAGNGDMVAQYDWSSKSFYLPIGLRFGKVWVLDKGSINAYAEYQTSAIYNSWEGPAVQNSFRLNFTYTMPFSSGKK
ncbi:hypothetical protein [Algibacter mikhailovii]|uniref:Neuromedin U n=1 Tax=Algibacter mikhailovii TaxID=425498 RepID=A0A918QUC8_9FLAO|nr:hypothetical protein [Algibacter mikhailovii]GGZ71452.1 hypothetical protein GCM10007028_05970 [Algibacter mikhailovii]